MLYSNKLFEYITNGLLELKTFKNVFILTTVIYISNNSNKCVDTKLFVVCSNL